MFNLFDSLKKENSLLKKDINFNIVFAGNNLLYAEGHKGLFKLEKEIVVFKVKNGVVTVKGENLFLKDLKKDTLTIKGKINSVEIL